MRSPSQRCRLSIVEVTPPRLVALMISLRRGLDGARLGDVERDQAAEAGVADVLDCRDARRAGRRSRSRSRCAAACAPRASRARAGARRPSSGEAVMPALTRSSRRRAVCGVARDRRAEQRVVVAGQELRRRVDDDVGALVERAQVDGRRDRRVADDQARDGRAARPSSARVSVGFAGDSTQTMSASGGGAGLVELDEADPERREQPDQLPGAEVRAFGERDRRAGAGEREQNGRRRAHAGRVEQRVAALERAERFLGRDAGRVVVARVVELPRLAGGVIRPDRRTLVAPPTLRSPPAPRHVWRQTRRT